MPYPISLRTLALTLTVAALNVGCGGGGGGSNQDFNVLPAFAKAFSKMTYNGTTG